MRQVDYSQRIEAPRELAWSVVSDFGSLLRWLPGEEESSIELTGDGIGMTRDLTLSTVGQVQHRLDELDHVKHRLTYTLTRGKPLGMQGYSVTLTLAGDEEHCILHWTGEFEPEPGADGDAMAENLAGAYANMSTGLDTLLQGWQDHG
mgnify:CR=1 FL=1